MKRPSDHSEGEGSHDRWLVSYADFITLMFAFFAVLYATSQKDMEKSKEFQESIKRFLIKAGGAGLGAGGGQAQINQAIKGNTPIEPPIPSFNPAKPEVAEALDEAEKFFSDSLTKEEQKKYVQDLAADEWGVRITLPATAIFATGSEKFREDAMPFISKLAALVAQTKRKVLIEGHVSAGEQGSFKSTWEFSSQRSLNMLRFMQRKASLNSDQLAAMSLGDSRPIYQNRDAKLNSRVEVVLLNPDMEL